MFAHVIVDVTGPEDVQWIEVAEPAAGDGVVMDVSAAGVSFADLLQTKGAYQMKVPVPYTPGMGAAGVVRSAPPGLGLVAGQRVAVLLSHGCWQEAISAPAERVLPLPEDMSVEAGAAGGLGSAAIQLGRALGLRTVAVVGDEGKRQFAVQRGADHAVLSGGWLAAVRDLLGERVVDIVVDPVGGDRMTDSLRSLAPEGRVLVLGFAGGEIPAVKVNRLLLGNIGVLGVASREFFEQHPAAVARLWARLIDLRRAGVLPDPPVQLYPFADARGALRAIAARQAKGTVVLSRQAAVSPLPG